MQSAVVRVALLTWPLFPPHNTLYPQALPQVAKRSMAGLSGSVIELSNYLETRISQKSGEYAAVSITLSVNFSRAIFFSLTLPLPSLFSLQPLLTRLARWCLSVTALLVCTA